MPKLVIKQDIEAVANKDRRNTWLSMGGLLLLLVTVTVAAYFFTRPVITSPVQQALVLDSAQDPVIKAKYWSMHKVFNALSSEYEKLSSQGPDDYKKNTQLVDKSGEILLHLEEMSALTDQLKLNDDESQQLFNRQQFNKDYWQAKSHFRQLRVSRFEKGGKQIVSVTEASLTPPSDTLVDEVADKPKKKFQFAKPPAGMELPAGFCDLSDPDSSCKPEANQVQAADASLPLPVDEVVDKPKKKFQFAKPPAGMELPAGFCDLSDPDSSCKPEANQAQAADVSLPLPADEVADKPKKKFQFAKPPAGMELPAGFCDLSDPDSSCKPEANQAEAADVSLPLPADISVDELADKPKKKFQFAKPPADMELPAGFCDLSNPASCKPEKEAKMTGNENSKTN